MYVHIAGMKEAEVRFAVVDPFIKGITSLTPAKVKLEESVKDSDTFTSTDNAVSKRSMPDYSVYAFYNVARPMKVFIVEVKTASALNKHSICQAIGYYMASEVITTVGKSICPSLAIVMSEKTAHLIYFPYALNNQPCIDAVVSSAIQLFENQGTNGYVSLFTWTVSYILACIEGSVTTIEDSGYTLQEKYIYANLVYTDERVMKTMLEEKEREILEERKLRQEKEREILEERKLRQKKEREILEERKLRQREIQEKERKIQELSQELSQSKRRKL